jgi:hypothetical protein
MRECISEFVEADLQVRPGRPEGRPLRIICITAGLLTVAPASALACPVCALIGPSDNTWAYQAMSAMLTLLPLAMIGGTVWWLARLATRADAECTGRPSGRPEAGLRPASTNIRGDLALSEGQGRRGWTVDG